MPENRDFTEALTPEQFEALLLAIGAFVRSHLPDVPVEHQALTVVGILFSAAGHELGFSDAADDILAPLAFAGAECTLEVARNARCLNRALRTNPS